MYGLICCVASHNIFDSFFSSHNAVVLIDGRGGRGKHHMHTNTSLMTRAKGLGIYPNN